MKSGLYKLKKRERDTTLKALSCFSGNKTDTMIRSDDYDLL